MYSMLRRVEPLRRGTASALLKSAAVPAAATWFHSAPAWETGAPAGQTGVSAWQEGGPAWQAGVPAWHTGPPMRAEFAAHQGAFYEEERRAGGAEEEGLEVAKLGVSHMIVERLAGKGITKLFPIQRAVLEPTMQGKDVVGRAKIGTGKTLAFGIPIMDAIIHHNEKYKAGRFPQAIVLVPTRELAKQVEKEFLDSSPLDAICVYGGTPISQQMRNLIMALM